MNDFITLPAAFVVLAGYVLAYWAGRRHGWYNGVTDQKRLTAALSATVADALVLRIATLAEGAAGVTEPPTPGVPE